MTKRSFLTPKNRPKPKKLADLRNHVTAKIDALLYRLDISGVNQSVESAIKMTEVWNGLTAEEKSWFDAREDFWDVVIVHSLDQREELSDGDAADDEAPFRMDTDPMPTVASSERP